MAERIQMSRAKGWRKPEGAVYVGRPSRWGNWHKVGMEPYDARPIPKDAAEAVANFRADVEWMKENDRENFNRWIAPLRGKDLACWCKAGAPCHADVLLELANTPEAK